MSSTENQRLDLLTGHKAIADYMGWSPRQVQYRAANGAIPTFKVGSFVCARKSSLVQWAADRADEAARRTGERCA